MRKILDFIVRLSEHGWGQLVLVAVPVLVVYIPIFLAGKVFVQGDILNYLYPTLYNFSLALQEGNGFLWNSNTLSGFPSFIFSAGLFSPINLLLFRFLNFLTAVHFLLAAYLILGGFFTARLLKELGVSNLAGVMSGVAYIISVVTASGADLPLINAAPVLPLLLWILLLNFKKSRWWLTLSGGLVIGLAFLSVHYNWLIIVLVGGFIFAIFLPWLYKRFNFDTFIKLIYQYAIMGIIGVVVGLIQILPIMAYKGLGSRVGGLAYIDSLSEALFLPDLFSFILPDISLPFLSSFPYLYLGIIPLFFLIYAVFVKGRLPRFFFWLFIFCLLLSFKYSPLFWVLQKMPVFEYFRSPSRWMFLGLFSASVAAGFGIDSYLENGIEKVKKRLLTIFKWISIIIVAVSLIVTTVIYSVGDKLLNWLKNYFDENIYNQTSGLPKDHYYQVIDNMFEGVSDLVNLSNLKFLLPVVILILSYLVLKHLCKGKSKEQSLAIIIVVVGLNFIAVFPYNSAVSMLADRAVFNYQPQTASFISREEGRVLPFMVGFGKYEKLIVPYSPNNEEMFKFESEMQSPKINILYNVASVDGLDSMMPKRYGQIIGLVGSDKAVGDNNLVNLDQPFEKKVELFQLRHNLLDMLGVRYVTSAYDLESDNLVEVFTAKTTQYEIPIYVFENKDYLPLVFLAKTIEYLNPGVEENIGTIIDSENNFNETTFIECSNCSATSKGEMDFEIVKHLNGYLEVDVKTSIDTWLVFNEQNLPGWKVTIDSERKEIHTANYLFQSVLIPSGEHKVVFEFKYGEVLKTLK